MASVKSRRFTRIGPRKKHPEYVYQAPVPSARGKMLYDDCVDYDVVITPNPEDSSYSLQIVLLPNLYTLASDPKVIAQKTIRCIEPLRADNWLYMRVRLAELAEKVFEQ